ncbi:MAG: NUDIX domain-containing protein [Candidatus Moraniibacteriota bacterium]
MEKEVKISIEEGQGVMTGVDVAVFDNEERVLLGKRLSKVGYGQWGFPGGHLKKDEKLLEAAKRELIEELGDEIKINMSKDILGIRENRAEPYKLHHVVPMLKGEYVSGEAKVNEPSRCEKWEWFDLDNLPSPLFSGIKETLENYKNNKATIITDWE